MSGNRTGFTSRCLLAAVVSFGVITRPVTAQTTQATRTLRPGYVVESWSAESGLPVNSVTDVLQARSGYIWLTTFDGIVRFDGVRFAVFNAGNTDALPTNRFLLISEAPDSSLWMLAESGQLMRWSRGDFTEIGPARGLVGGAVWSVRPLNDSTMVIATAEALHLYSSGHIRVAAKFPSMVLPVSPFDAAGRELAIGADGTIWVAAGPAQLLRVDPDMRVTDVSAQVLLGRKRPPHIHALPDHSLLIGVQHGLFRWTGGQLTPSALREPVHGITRGAVTGRVLVSARGGLYSYDPLGLRRIVSSRDRITTEVLEAENGELWHAVSQTVYRNGEPVFAAAGMVRKLATDREGSIWLGTDAGLYRIKPARVLSVSPLESNARSTYPILEAADGSILMGLLRGGLVSYRNGKFVRLGVKDGLPSDMILALHQDRDGALWVGGWGGACRWEAPQCTFPTPDSSFRNSHLRAIHRDRSGVMWFGTETGLYRWHAQGFDHLTTRDGLPHDWVRVITEAHDGTLWFGTNGGGAFTYRNGAFQTVGVAEGLSSPLVRAIHEDSLGTVWIGTEGRGLDRLEPDSTSRSGYRVTVYRASDGLYDDVVHEILEDEYGRMWLSSNRGIFRVPRAELDAFAAGRLQRIHSTAYGERDGMRTREANGGVDGAALRASDGRLWFATVDGAAVIDPSIIEGNRLPPPVVIEGVSSGGAPLTVAAATIRLQPNQRDFQVDYTGLSFLAPENMRFRYQLVGFTRDWVDARNRRTAFFTNVPPGNYEFRVVASNNDGVWNEQGASLHITVTPYFYERGLFRGVVLAGLAVVILLLLRSRLEWHRKRQDELARLVEARTAQLAGEQRTTEEARAESERHRLRAEDALALVQSQAERLQRLDAAKTRFFANVSHEFRTPLTLTIGPLEDLQEGLHGPLPEDAVHEVDVALQNSRRLLKLVNELLDITKLEAGEMKLRASAGDLAAAVESIAQAFRPLAERRRIDLRVEHDALDVDVYFDADVMEHVLGNLLSNALKFTPEGGTVRVRLDVVRDAELGAAAEIEVRDSGTGIPEAELPHIFERFYQVSESPERLQPGTGIGLSLTKELVELHRGRILVESTEGFGTTLRVRLRLGSAHLTAEEIVAAPPPRGVPGAVVDDETPVLPADVEVIRPGEDRPTVLVVDDNAEVRAYVRKHLAPHYGVVEAADGEAAITAARASEPDLILCDVMMPGVTGWDVVRRLRDDPATDFIPIILLTAQAEPERRIQGLELGADDYLTKPFSTPELLARVRNLIASRKRLRFRFRAIPIVPGSQDEDPLIGRLRSVVLEHIEDDEFGVEELARKLALSRSHLYRKVHQLTGSSAADVVRSIRLQRAMSLLSAGAGNVTEVAYAVGFKSLSHFSRCFRSEFGVSPSALRTAQRAVPGEEP